MTSKRVEDKMPASQTARTPLAEAFLELLKSGGKRLRPAVALASYGLYHPAADDRRRRLQRR
jgi:geranylgeranyl pyrophosphate synthase